DALRELEGTKYLRLHQFRKAAEVFAGTSQMALGKYTLPDPFSAGIRDRIETDASDSAHEYTKLEFAEKMVSLEGREDDQSLFAYGCGLYSMTYYGKAHHAYDYYRHTTDELAYYSTPERNALPAYLQDYYGA